MQKLPPQGRARRGVALLEVLMAAAVIGIGLGISFRTMSLATRHESLLERRATATRLAQDTLIELRGANQLQQAGQTSGKYESPFDTYSWTANVQPTPTEPSHWHIRITVEHTEKDQTLHLLETIIFNE